MLDGAYSASPFLKDLIDLAVLVNVPAETRHMRISVRERHDADFVAGWHAIWDEVEDHYFNNICLPGYFDLIISNDDH